MADKPITFSAPMVRALLAGTKTQTRRLVSNPEYYGCPTGDCPHNTQAECNAAMAGLVDEIARFKVGDRVYVREAYYQFGHWEPVEGKQTKGGKQKWAFFGTCMVRFDAPEEFISSRDTEFPGVPKWYKRLGRFMPRAESRMWLEITDVRVQRLQDISEDDAKAEGIVWQEPTEEDRQWAVDQAVEYGCSADIEGVWTIPGAGGPGKADIWGVTPQQSYQFLWNSLHTDPGTTWADNPWIVAYTFKVHHGNIDGVEHNGFPGQVEGEGRK